jgi:predicted phosphodiesterase
MKLGIIHLSDCHIDDCNEPFLNRVHEMASTIRAFKKADSWVIIFSGDISNSGNAEQILRGAAFLKEVQTEISNITGADPKLIVIPGNHDCNIPSEEIRIGQTDNVRTGKMADKEALLTAQTAFWHTFPISDIPTCNSNMAFISQFEVGGETVALIGVNSSWMSDLHERQGGIQFQPQWFDPITAWIYQNEPDVVIASIHHPIHWQKEDVQKPLWHKLAKVTDLLLTGHEHLPDGYVRQTNNSTIGVFEGGLLSERITGYDHCTFQVLFIDTQNGGLEQAVCSWESTRSEFILNRSQNQFRQNIGRVKNAFHDQWLAEIEVSLLEACHPRKNPVKLSDYFVWPHMRWTDKTKHTERKVKSNSDFLALLKEMKYLRITGTIKSGKTSLLRRLAPFLKQNGFTPIFLDGAECETADKAIKRALTAQYVDLTVDTLHAAKNIVFLFDNWERLRLRLDKRLELLEELLQISSYCALTTSINTDIEYLSSGRTSMLDAFQDLAIEPLTRSKRSELLQRWASIAAPLEIEVEEIERVVEQANDKISTILGENLVRATPIITVMLWRELESGVTSTQGVGSSGHLYKHLIEYSLAHSSIKASEIGWDQRYSFLGFLAVAMFRKKALLTRADIQITKDAFVREICLQPDLEAIIKDCCSVGMLKEKDDTICFAFEFGLYYFTAYYLNEHREVEAAQIQEMIKNLYVFENMQTITFYLYLSGDSIVMNAILDMAVGFQDKAEEFKFELMPNVNKTISDAMKPKLITEKIEDRPSFDSVVAKSKNQDAEVRDIVLARRLSYVLGQVVSNFPAKVASRIGAERRDNFLKQAYRLELVALANSLKLLTAHAEEFLGHLRYHISHAPAANVSSHDESKILQRAIPALLHFMVVQVVLEIPARLCSKDLLSVHDKIAEINGSHNRIYTVINTAIRIDQSSTYPTSLILEKAKEFSRANDGSWDILRDIVYLSLLKFKRLYKVRQQMCQEFDIKGNAQMFLEEA